MNLADIKTADESIKIKNVINSYNITGDNKSRWWIGLNDNGSEGTFYWVHNGIEMDYDDFASFSNQPDNAGGNENCVEIWGYDGQQWNDATCDLKLFFICRENDSSFVHSPDNVINNVFHRISVDE